MNPEEEVMLEHTAAEVDDNIDEVVAARGTFDSLDERLDATEVPEVGADDDGKVLKATYSEGVGTYTWEDEGGGTTDYTDLSNKPSINNVTLSGNKTASDLGIGEVPEVGVNDDGKVLKASYTGGVGTYSWQTGGGGGGGTSDYSDLDNKPQINSITLSGNKTSSDLGLQSEIDSSHKLSADLIDDTNATNKFVTASEKNTWNGKQDALTFDNEPTASSNNPVKSGGVYTALSGKVDVESGKGLSANDFTDAYKSKLDGIASGAEVNVQSDWNQTNNAADDYIKNKPTLGTAAAAATTDFATAAQGAKADSALQGLKVNNSAVLPDSNKIVSITIPTSAADVSAIPTSAKGANSGVAELDATGKVPASQLPSYVDDVIEGYYYNSKFYEDSAHTTEITGTTGKIYVDLSTNKTYRWSGSGYTEISASLALGTTSSTAYRGDRGATAYTHATDSSRLTAATSSGLYKVASTSQGHIASLTAVQKSDITALGIPAQDTTVGSGIVLTGYEKSSTGGQAVEATDTVNEAIGKIEKRVSDNETTISTDEAALVELVDGGAKSLLPNNAVSQTLNSVVFVVNADGSVKAVSGTASTAVYLVMYRPNLKKGKYVISGSDGEIGVGIGTNLTSTSIIALSRNGNPVEFELTNDTNNLYYFVRMSTGATANNNTVYPMICTTAAWDISHKYVPYRPSEDEQNAQIAQNTSDIADNGLTVVLSQQSNSSSTYAYQMKTSDFPVPYSCGAYLISIISWGTTPTYSLYSVAYSGNHTDYTVITKIAGTDANVTVSGDSISITSSGKVTIMAMR